MKSQSSRTKAGELRVKYAGEKMPTIPECIAKIEESGYKFSHVFGSSRVFTNPNRVPSELIFTLREMREAYYHGF